MFTCVSNCYVNDLNFVSGIGGDWSITVQRGHAVVTMHTRWVIYFLVWWITLPPASWHHRSDEPINPLNQLAQVCLFFLSLPLSRSLSRSFYLSCSLLLYSFDGTWQHRFITGLQDYSSTPNTNVPLHVKHPWFIQMSYCCNTVVCSNRCIVYWLTDWLKFIDRGDKSTF
jgi:hypothetical protein